MKLTKSCFYSTLNFWKNMKIECFIGVSSSKCITMEYLKHLNLDEWMDFILVAFFIVICIFGKNLEFLRTFCNWYEFSFIPCLKNHSNFKFSSNFMKRSLFCSRGMDLSNTNMKLNSYLICSSSTIECELSVSVWLGKL